MSSQKSVEQARNEMRVKMSEVLGVPLEHLQDEELLVDAVSESFKLIEMVIELQETYRVRMDREDLEKVRTVGDLLTLLVSRLSN